MLSEKFIISIKMNKEPAYRIANNAGIHPSTLSQLVHGAARVKPNDSRVISVGKVLGLKPGECFDNGEVEA